MTAELTCRFCATPLAEVFVDLGKTPLANSLPRPDMPADREPWLPLIAYRCLECALVQVPDVAEREEVFDDYPYFSSTSSSWLAHAERYAQAMIPRLGLDASSLVVEVASNDGYLLQYFRDADIRVLGVEPADTVAEAALAREIPTEVDFFGEALATDLVAEHGHADLVIGNNVFAHVPDLNDFTAGLARMLAPTGTLTLEFPHLLELIRKTEFDTIYHEHYSYYWLATARRVLARHGLEVVDVERLTTHGGSLRLFARHAGAAGEIAPAVAVIEAEEAAAGRDHAEGYRGFAQRVATIKRDLLAFLAQARAEGKVVAGYGAPAKGNTLLNYCGVDATQIPFTVDKAEAKQGRLLPGSRIPIHAPETLAEARPDYILILPWNIRDEIMSQVRALPGMDDWAGSFVIAVPRLDILS